MLKTKSNCLQLGTSRLNNVLKKTECTEESRNDEKTSFPKMKPLKSRNKLKIKSLPKVIENPSVINSTPPDSKQDAFLVMMNSRSKVIGSNSPGKQIVEPVESMIEKSTRIAAKAALKFKLQAMSERKGSLKIKLSDVERDEQLKDAMEKRAKRLKRMLSNNGSIKNKMNRRSCSIGRTVENLDCQSKQSLTVCSDDELVINNVIKKSTLISNISSTERLPPLIKKSTMSKDDDFLQKLSPSMKRKESMLSYFNKLENVQVNDRCKNGKIRSKVKNGSRENKAFVSINWQRNGSIQNQRDPPGINNSSLSNNHDQPCILHDTNGRPKRAVRRPAKYISESEDEFIESVDKFSISRGRDKKKKLTKDRNECKKIKATKNETGNVIDVDAPTSAKNIKPSINSFCVGEHNISCNSSDGVKKLTFEGKLAPLFMPKRLIDPAVIAARKEFLHSGVPNQVKRFIEKQKVQLEAVNDYFSPVCHVQQKQYDNTSACNPWNLLSTNICLFNDDEMPVNVTTNNRSLGEITQSKWKSVNTGQNIELNIKPENVSQTLKDMKYKYPQFPFYKIYNQFMEKYKFYTKNFTQPQNSKLKIDDLICSEFANVEDIPQKMRYNSRHKKSITWTEKYKPVRSNDLMCNQKSVHFLKNWLSNWKEYSDDVNRKHCEKTHTRRKSSSSDEFYPSDSDSRDSSKQPNNILILTGPRGCGKTSAIYATANELNIKVLEINASSKRSGKRMMGELQEATQSHKVIRCQSFTSDTLSQNIFTVLTNGKDDSQDSNNCQREDDIFYSTDSQNYDNGQCMSMILVEDADVVFEQDDGFIAALAQIVQTSKRPVLLVTSDLGCAHLQRFITTSNVVKFFCPNTKITGAWLDIMCLIECSTLPHWVSQHLLEYNRGDVRKTIHQLQFLIQGDISKNAKILNLESGIQSKTSVVEYEIFDSDSNSSLQNRLIENSHSKEIEGRLSEFSYFHCFMDVFQSEIFQDSSFGAYFPINTVTIWWNIFPLLKHVDSTDKNLVTQVTDLKILVKFLNNMSNVQCIEKYISNLYRKETLCTFWEAAPLDSTSEEEDFFLYRWHQEVSLSWFRFMLASSIQALQDTRITDNFGLDISLPKSDNRRRQMEIQNANGSLCDAIPLNFQLQRRGLALDYLPGLRSICRSEKDRKGSNLKRNNRFSHYVKVLGVNCKENDYDVVCNSLAHAD